MGVPIIFLIISPVAGVIALQLTPPFSRLAVALSLIFSICGLVLLYRYLLLPLRTFVTAISQPDSTEIPSIPAASDIVRALKDSLKSREAAFRHELAEAREAADKLSKKVQELRDKHSGDIQTKQTILATLRKAQSELNTLAAAADADNGLPVERLRIRERILDLSATLHHSECILLHDGQLLNAASAESGDVDHTPEDYVNILDKKSQRLKVLIEDLFEASKAASGAMELNIAKIDIGQLLKQALGENDERFKDSNLNVKLNVPEEKIFINGDGKRLYRVFENLISNIVKYSLSNTRVYIDMYKEEKEVIIVMRNISAYELSFDTNEITNRFKRGDSSRSTEGSGLGLAIAKSIVELHGGSFNIEVDGDLFKSIIRLK